jgi:hypothetical protein
MQASKASCVTTSQQPRLAEPVFAGAYERFACLPAQPQQPYAPHINKQHDKRHGWSVYSMAGACRRYACKHAVCKERDGTSMQYTVNSTSIMLV